MKDKIIAALKTVFDPEIPMDIWNLGLIYDVQVSDGGLVHIRMTLTAPNCPVAGSLPAEVERKARSVAGVKDVKLELTFDPPWDKSRMSADARALLGLDDIIPLGRLGSAKARR
jgi:FeS assembly SUF system protein